MSLDEILLALADMRRGAGIGSLQKQTVTKDTFREVSQALSSTQIEQLKSQLEVFKRSLEEFSKKYQKDIAKNPLLRSHFQKMCGVVGVDPLVSSKGFWVEVLGIGDFYYEIGIQIVETCLVLQEQTGGIIDLSIIKKRIQKLRRNKEEITEAIGTLKPLGSGYAILDLGGRKVLQSMPFELSPDSNIILTYGEKNGYLSEGDWNLLGWQPERFIRALKFLVDEEIVWIDQHEVILYWFPCFFKGFE